MVATFINRFSFRGVPGEANSSPQKPRPLTLILNSALRADGGRLVNKIVSFGSSTEF